MTDKVNIVVPVAPFEPLSIIKKSVESLKQLHTPQNCEKKIFYVIDTDEEPEEDERVTYLREDTPEIVETVVRTSNEGRRAGAINEVLEKMDQPEYVAIFDVDSRPGENFLEVCIDQLKQGEEIFMSTCPREIVNSNQNFITKIVDAEYDFLMDMQMLLEREKGFNHFNGLISVLDGEYLVENKLDESMTCEDTEFTERAYLNGKRPAINDDSYVGEQAVTSLSDLYSQKVRWMNGALEGILNFSVPFLKSDLPVRVRMSWMSSMFLPFFAAVLSPLAIFQVFRNILEDKKFVNPVKKGFALFIFAWFISFCGLVNIAKLATGSEVEWKTSQREVM